MEPSGTPRWWRRRRPARAGLAGLTPARLVAALVCAGLLALWAATDAGRGAGRGPVALPALSGTKPVAVIWAPHPDDETYGAAGIIAGLLDRGYSVVEVLLTHGEASVALDKVNAERAQAGQPPYTRRGFGRARVREYQAAAGAAGVDACIIYDFPDGGLTWRDVRAVVEEVDREYRPAAHYGTAGGDDEPRRHPDHAALYFGLARARVSAAEKNYYYVYATPAGRAGVTLLPLDAGARRLKAAMLDCYRLEDWRSQRYGIGFHSTPTLWLKSRAQTCEYLRAGA